MRSDEEGGVSERVRMTLDLSAQLNADLEALAAETGRTKADLLRLGLDYLTKATRARKEGMTVGAWKDDPEHNIRREREFVGI